MNKKDLISGFVLEIFTAILAYLFIVLFTKFDILSGIQTIKENGDLGKVITLCTTLNLVVFAVLLKKDKEFMAGGVILAVIFLAISTLLT